MQSTYQSQFNIGIVGKHDTQLICAADFYHSVKNVLYSIQKRGIGKKDKLIFQTNRLDDYLYLFWACILGGIVPVLLSPIMTDRDKEKLYAIWKKMGYCYIVSDNNINKVFGEYVEKKSGKQNIHKIIEIQKLYGNECEGDIAEVEEKDVVLIQYSSGSTGDPKGIVITHENLLCDLWGIIKCQDISSKDIFFSWLPLSHNLGLIVMHVLPLIMQSTHYIMPKEIFAYNPKRYLECIENYSVTISASPNFGLKYIVELLKHTSKAWNLSNIRFIWNGAEPIDPMICDLFCEKMAAFGFKGKIVAGYGLAEATVVVTVMNSSDQHRYLYINREDLYIGNKIVEGREGKGSLAFVELGMPIPGCKLRISDNKDSDLGKFRIGYIQVKGNNIMKEYYKDDKATEEAFTEDGWLNTGDIGFLYDNNLVVTGRNKDMIIINGKNYFVNDIEQICVNTKHKFHGEVFVCGIDEKKKTESIAIFIVGNEMTNNMKEIIDDIKKSLYENGISNKKYFFIANSIPKTVSGKVKRNILKKKAEEHIYNVREQVEKKLLIICSDIIKENIGMADLLMEMNLSSLKVFSISAYIEDELQVQISPLDFYKFSTLREVAEYIEEIKLMCSEIFF